MAAWELFFMKDVLLTFTVKNNKCLFFFLHYVYNSFKKKKRTERMLQMYVTYILRCTLPTIHHICKFSWGFLQLFWFGSLILVCQKLQFYYLLPSMSFKILTDLFLLHFLYEMAGSSLKLTGGKRLGKQVCM